MMKKLAEILQEGSIVRKKQRGITLIALVVTIIVLLILAGVSVSMLTGQNGILTNAAKAKENTEAASDLEFLQTKAYEAVTNYYVKGQTGSENEYILEELGKVSGVETSVSQGTVKYNGKTYDISEIIGNTSEQKAIEKEKGLKQVTAATATDAADKQILSSTDSDGNAKVRMIIVEENTDNTTIKAVIPSGFYYVTGKPSTGLVISDKFDDDDNNSKGGNQFVWVPCNGGKAKYKAHTYATANVDDLGGSTADTGNGGWKTYYYRNYSDWQDNAGEATVTSAKANSVATYGGFYVARFEAGEPTNASFYNDKDGSTYWQIHYNEDASINYGDNTNKPDASKTYKDTYKTKNVTEQDGKKLLPVSKKNTPSWNYISQTNSKTVSENMYGESKTIKSYLIDGTAWDTITQWVSDSTKKSVTDSTAWGNYFDSSYTLKGLYARHQGRTAKDNVWRWFPAYVYNNGSYTKGSEYTEVATGVTVEGDPTRNSACNIYDMAGNMWEWTTETGKHDSKATDATNYAVLRGGSFSAGLTTQFLTVTVAILLATHTTSTLGSVSCFTSNRGTDPCKSGIEYMRV